MPVSRHAAFLLVFALFFELVLRRVGTLSSPNISSNVRKNFSSPWITQVLSNTSAHTTSASDNNHSGKSENKPVKSPPNTRFILKLYDFLFAAYHNEIRPVVNDSQPVAVIVKFWLKQILKVNERDQTLNIYCWLEMYWRDEFLTWDPNDFGGLNIIHVPSSKIWRPDILVYNNANMNVEDSELETNAIIKFTGEVTLFRAMITDITCTLSLLLFPFDQQVCYLTFASWSMDGSKLLISPLNLSTSLELYIRNTEWELIDFAAKMYEKIYDCCPHPFPDLTFFIALKRSPSYYIFSLIVPSAFITVVTIVGFFTPHSTTGENHEKVSTAVTALLSMTIIMMMISDEVPPTSEVMPLIGKYYIGLIFIIFVAAFTTTVTLALQMRGNAGARMSARMRHFLFDRVAKSLIGSWLFTIQITDPNSTRGFQMRRRQMHDDLHHNFYDKSTKRASSGNGELRTRFYANSGAKPNAKSFRHDLCAKIRANSASKTEAKTRRNTADSQPRFFYSRNSSKKAASEAPPLSSPLIGFPKSGNFAGLNSSAESNYDNINNGSNNENNNDENNIFKNGSYSKSYDRFDKARKGYCHNKWKNRSCEMGANRVTKRRKMLFANEKEESLDEKNVEEQRIFEDKLKTNAGNDDIAERICECVQTIEDYINQMHEQRFIEFEWEQGARIIERLVMIFYIIFTMAFAFFMLGNTGEDIILTDELMDHVKR